MKVITQRTLIREVASRWHEQYERGHGMGEDKDVIADKLDALDGETATAAKVKRIIGNDSWTTVPECDECGERMDAVVQLGQEPTRESSTANVCVPCLRAALKAAIKVAKVIA